MPVMYGPPRSGGSLYTAIGDSLTAGYGVPALSSFVAVYARWLQGQGVGRHINLGINGLTADQLAGMLSSNGQLIEAVRRASLITVTIGSNDLLHLVPYLLRGLPVNVPWTVKCLGENMRRIAGSLRGWNPYAAVQFAGLYNPLALNRMSQFAGFVQPAQAIIAQANRVLEKFVREAGYHFVPVEPWLNAEKFAGRTVLGRDLIHPGLYGYQAIAAAFESDYALSFRFFPTLSPAHR